MRVIFSGVTVRLSELDLVRFDGEGNQLQDARGVNCILAFVWFGSSFQCQLSRNLKLQRSIKHGYAIKFCTGLEKSVMEALAISQQNLKSVNLSKTIVLRWHKCFNGHESMED